MELRSVLAQLKHPKICATVSALAVAGAVYYYKKQKKVIEEIQVSEIQDSAVQDPELTNVIDMDVIDDQEVKKEKPLKLQMTPEDFICIAVIGRGSFGKVMLAEYKKTKELFAMKAMKKRDTVNNDCVDRVMCERRVLELVTMARHPFLINMFASFQTEQHTCFVLEYAAGGDLLTHVEAKRLSEPRTVFYSACAVLGIEFLHKKNIAHRDIKLANMLLDSEGYLKVADFGHCKEEMGLRNYTNSLAGTTEYLTPEQIMAKPYTRVADWWALGVCIYEMLVGLTPFESTAEEETRCNIVSGHVTFPKYLSSEAILIFEKLTIKDPWRRLGAGLRGAEMVKQHCFFRDVSWGDLEARRLKPPWVPTINHPTDVSNFEEEFTTESPELTPPLDRRILTAGEQEMFKGFDTLCPLRESTASDAESVASK